MQIDKLTVTFYGDEECETAKEFRAKAVKEYGSVNNALKEIVKGYLGGKGKNGRKSTDVE